MSAGGAIDAQRDVAQRPMGAGAARIAMRYGVDLDHLAPLALAPPALMRPLLRATAPGAATADLRTKPRLVFSFFSRCC